MKPTIFNTDSPVPSIIPENVPIGKPKKSDTPESRQVVQHTETSQNKTETATIPAKEQRQSAQVSTTCNCGVHTGHVYDFEIVYKKTKQAKNPITGDIRRDWLYIQLQGNLDGNAVSTDRFLIYLK